jgi:uncharacterized membrane protein
MTYVLLVLKVLLAVFFILAGLNHFRTPDFYTNIMPQWMPAHEFLVFLSGVTEIIAGVMLLVPRLSRWGAWFIVAHLVAFFPVHIDMIVNAERYPDIPLAGLWLRIVIGWALLFTRKPVEVTQPAANAV